MKKIITKYIVNTITEDEQNLLNEWLKDRDNQKEFKRYVLDYHDVKMALYKNDVDKAYRNVKEAINNSKQKVIPIYRKKFFKYAAAVLVLVSSSFFFLSKNTPVENNNVSINPGTDKAILTLANGTELLLDSVTNYQDKLITSTGKEIIYTPSENKTNTVEYNYLTIPRGGQYHIVLSDDTEVWVNSESQLKYPVNFIEGQPRDVELVYGEAYFEVSPSTEHGGAKFRVINENQTIEVLGTKFNVKAYKEEPHIYTTLVEGKVSVNTKLDAKLLVPNKQSVFSLKNENLSIQDVDVKIEIAWIHGEFVFQKKSLKDIATVLGRWYNVDFEFLNDTIAEQKFNGELKKSQNLENILKLIQDTNKIKSYEMKGNSVFLK
ncbi:FecR family protein [Algibacter miyuki]|uniref:FecR family protein n=1 Tax=Algibacter miyuki TaxID=1306933 RepID=A0ABV5H2Q1_9FLAO|nr:FecR family protein [Algibacter miyuki]MDN3663851.1 FecR family protein [Algibacter miyuki]